MRKYFAEMLGTFALTLAVALSLAGQFPVPTPVIAGLTLGLFVYTIGNLSGSHINPAVTIGAWSIKKISTKRAIGYIIFQFIGAEFAFIVSRLIIAQPAALVAANTWPVFFGELLGTFFFTFGIASVIYEKAPAALSGIVVGGSLLLGISFAALLSNGVLNPAVAYGIGSFSLAYLLGPICGSVLGMQVFRWLEE